MSDSSDIWQLCVDTGGTFTDAIARSPDGRIHRAKVLSSSELRGTIDELVSPNRVHIHAHWLETGPNSGTDAKAQCGEFFNGVEFKSAGTSASGTEPITVPVASFDWGERILTLDRDWPGPAPVRGDLFEIGFDEEAPILAARLITGTSLNQPLPPMEFRLATTRGTNALLEERGAPTVLFTTRGFADVLHIGHQQRDDLFALDIRKPQPLHMEVFEVSERMSAGRSAHDILDLSQVMRRFETVCRDHPGVSIAIALLNSYANPEHERALRDALEKRGCRFISVSSELCPFIGFTARTETTVVNAYLAPIIRTYLERIESQLDERSTLFLMTSAGGLQSVDSFHAKDSMLSGPAGGIAGAARASGHAGESRVIAFDMGGTSTDVSRYDGDFDYTFEHRVGRARLVAPALAIETVAAGGGSVCWFDGARLRVGPESAGANPGPACYGAGGPLTVTDVNLQLNRLDPARFQIPVDRSAAECAMKQLQNEVQNATGDLIPFEDLARGLLDIADERMADAIRRISVRSGFDPAEYTLVAFGGAGPQHACAVAERLGMKRVLVPPDAGLLSAWGLDHARIERFADTQILKPLDSFQDHELEAVLRATMREAAKRLKLEGIEDAQIEIRRIIAALRYIGQESTIEIELDTGAVEQREGRIRDLIQSRFEREYQSIFGHAPINRASELVSIRSIASERKSGSLQASLNEIGSLIDVDRIDSISSHAIARSELSNRTATRGPMVVTDADCTTVIARGWSATLDQSGAIRLERDSNDRANECHGSSRAAPEVIQLELFTNRFRAIVTEMGEMLRRTAVSTNVKERLDFSCALLNADAELVVNAPHIPVHLGAMGECVRSVRDHLGEMRPDDCIITNHPAFGGSHLPDITLISPVFLDEGNDQSPLIGYVANRAHHAEIGGTRPGSMPPSARTLAEEGVVIPPMHLVRGAEAQWDRIESILTLDAAFPTRAVEDNLADLRAALAANRRGVSALQSLARHHSMGRVQHYMNGLTAQAESLMSAALAHFEDRRFQATEHLDDGTPINVDMKVRDVHITIDFAGTGATHEGNLNATPAIVRSAVMYVMRLLINEPIPLNEGMMRCVTIRIPENTILNPRFHADDPAQSPAVVGGNVETSQRLVDTLIKALGLCACGQGTMNNVLFGNDSFGYYETIGGGSGAGPGFDGASGLHTHMTNTRLTDPEVIEHRYPVRVIRHEIRRGSGGEGEFKGGNGITRELEFTEPVELSVLTQHRTVAPFGLAGGADGEKGRQYVTRTNADGSTQTIKLNSIDACDIKPGDHLTIETPSGGGYGNPQGSN